MDRVQGLVNRQADLVLDAAIDKGIAEIRFGSISVTGRVDFYFTGDIQFPDNIFDFIQQQRNKRRQLASEINLIDVMTGVGDPSDDYNPDVDESPEILDSWDLISITKGGLSIQLIFKEPLEVS